MSVPAYERSYRDGLKETLLRLNVTMLRHRLECRRQIQNLQHGPGEIESEKAGAVLVVFCTFYLSLKFPSTPISFDVQSEIAHHTLRHKQKHDLETANKRAFSALASYYFGFALILAKCFMVPSRVLFSVTEHEITLTSF